MNFKRAQAQLIFLLLFGSILGYIAEVQAADRYKIDPTHTLSFFEYSHWGLSLQRGRFDRNAGFIELDVENKQGKVEIDIDAKSVNTGNTVFDAALRSDSFFDAEQFPKLSFKSTQFLFDENGQVVGLEGELTIKSVTKSVKFELTHFNCRFMPLYLSRACGANGHTKILRSEFDMGRYTPFVSDEVTLYFNVEAIKE